VWPILQFIILTKITLPVSLPIIATVLLWTAVGHWNAWFDSIIYTNESKKLVLQAVLRRIVLEGSQEMMDFDVGEGIASNLEAIKSATIVITTLPIVMVYPFVQKYFIKGIMVGSLKG
ncbi:MAG TPA: carbohydrate ABC transporter permease, partial [Clostridiaceae bacterium]|nr:carbohydrate ABC transporter permease [Clostridiaceae bacterium]